MKRSFANSIPFGGDFNRVVLWGQSAGASLIAGYLAHAQFHGRTGHGVQGAILNSSTDYAITRTSAYFGNNPNQLTERSAVECLKKLNIPLFISRTKIDIPIAIAQADNVRQVLCDAGRCPTYLFLADHSHISQNYLIGTADVQLPDFCQSAM